MNISNNAGFLGFRSYMQVNLPSLSDGTLKLEARQIEKVNKTNEILSYAAQSEIDNIQKCWRYIIDRYFESVNSYKMLIPLGQVNKFFNAEINAFILKLLLSHYQDDKERFCLFNCYSQSYPSFWIWIKNVLTLYFCVMKYLENNSELENNLRYVCQAYKILFNDHFTCWALKEGFSFEIKDGFKKNPSFDQFNSIEFELNENQYFKFQFSRQTLILHPSNKQQSRILSHFFKNFLLQERFIKFIEKSRDIKEKDEIFCSPDYKTKLKLSRLAQEKIVEVLCQNKTFEDIHILLDEFRVFLCNYCWKKDWAKEKLTNFIEWDNLTVLTLLNCFTQAELISVKEAEALLCSVIQMLSNSKVKMGFLNACLEILNSFVTANLINIETIFLKLIKVIPKSYNISKFSLANGFYSITTRKCDEISKKENKNAELNEKKLRHLFIESFSRSDYDIMAFVIYLLTDIHNWTLKNTFETIDTVKEIFFRIAENPLIPSLKKSEVNVALSNIEKLQNLLLPILKFDEEKQQYEEMWKIWKLNEIGQEYFKIMKIAKFCIGINL